MKREDLLNAIGGVDEELLLEPAPRAQRPARNTIRFVLVAAVIIALAISAGAATGLFGRPIANSSVITGVTVAPFDMDENGDVDLNGIPGQKVCMEVQIDSDAPLYLQEIYCLKLSDQWQQDGGGSSGTGKGQLFSITRHFRQEGKTGQLRLHQSNVTSYKKDNCVGTLPYLSADIQVTSEVTVIGGINLLKVTIPSVDGETAKKGPYCPEGETRLYWSDGKYILELDCPAWMDDAQIEAVMKDIYTEPYTVEIDPNYGIIDPDAIMASDPDFYIEKGNTGTNHANIIMGNGHAIYSDGYIYYGVSNTIYRTNTKTLHTSTFSRNDEFWPEFLCATDKYICYLTNSWTPGGIQLIRMTKDFQTREVLAKGVYSSIYVDGMDIYALDDKILNRIDLETGETTLIAQDCDMYYVDDNYIYIAKGNSFSCGRKDVIDFERHELSFKPIRMLVHGEDVYFAVQGSWQLIRYRNGREEPLPVHSYYFQFLGDRLIYNDATYYTEHNWTVRNYDLNTGETTSLQENVYNFYILNEQYILFNLNGSNQNVIVGTAGSDNWVLLDTQTGKCKNLN